VSGDVAAHANKITLEEIMKTLLKGKFRSVAAAALLGAGLYLAFASVLAVRAKGDNGAPDLPPVCEKIEAPAGNKLAFRVYAVGVQRYRWNGASWDFVEPVATLYADAKYDVKVGIHYAGPTWESILGGKVVATRVDGCSPDPASIPWLLLRATSADGVLGWVTYIQRLNTKGGLAPIAPGASTGVMAEIPYTAEYYFYRAGN
jgi:uncharacterized protein DUF3455